MSISLSSTSSQDLLRQLLQQQQAAAQASATASPTAAGQTSPGADAGAVDSAESPPPPPPPKPDGAADQRFGSETLGALISSQGGGATATAAGLVTASDTDGNGELSADEITASLTQAGDSIDGGAVASAVKALDTDGDGALSTSEIASGLQATHSAHHHGHGGHHLKVDTASGADSAQPASATSGDVSSGVTPAPSALDADSSASFSLGELNTAIQAFASNQAANLGASASQGAGVSIAA